MDQSGHAHDDAALRLSSFVSTRTAVGGGFEPVTHIVKDRANPLH
jgi:hypothetical protein